MAKKSRDKGAAYEREVARLLFPWLGFKIIRTPLSGGWAKCREDAKGDLTCASSADVLDVCIECKHYARDAWSMDAVVRGECALLEEWWGQLERSRGKRPGLLVFKRSYVPAYVAISDRTASVCSEQLRKLNCVALPTLGCRVYLLEPFLKAVSYDLFVACARLYQ